MADEQQPKRPSAAATWAAIRPLIDLERDIGARMAARPATAFAYELLRFGMKQAWACLFGGIMVGLLLATHFWYPRAAALSRYDFLFLAAVGVQIALLTFRLETFEEAKVILVYHVVGTVMELFKTSVGSWIYPEYSVFRIGAVPLFTGFMYSCIGSYLCRAWTLFHFEFARHPPRWALVALSLAIYVNFFRIIICPTSVSCCLLRHSYCLLPLWSTSRTGARGGACRCCSASCWWPSLSGLPKMPGPTAGLGSIQLRRAGGRPSAWQSTAHGSCC